MKLSALCSACLLIFGIVSAQSGSRTGRSRIDRSDRNLSIA